MNIKQEWLSNKVSGIYCIENLTTNDKYIGSSLDIYTRLHRHKSDLLKNRHSSNILQNSFNKHKIEKFICYILEIVNDPMNLTKIEQSWIDLLNPRYNLTKKVIRNVLSEESRKKISETLKRRYKSGEINITKSSPIDVFDEEGILLKKFNTIIEASKELNMDRNCILKVLNGTYRQMSGLRFRYQKDNITQLDKLIKNYPQNRKSSINKRTGIFVDVFDRKRNFIKRFQSINQCSRELNLTPSIIHNRLKKGAFDNDIYIFKYAINEEPS